MMVDDGGGWMMTALASWRSDMDFMVGPDGVKFEGNDIHDEEV